MVREFAIAVVLVTVAACTENNPNSCVNNPAVCKVGTTCKTGKDSKGREWSLCVPIDGLEPDGSVSPPADGPNQVDMVPDAAASDVTSPSPDAPPDATRLLDTLAPMPDVAPSPDGLACPNACIPATQRCGTGGGVQTCSMPTAGCPTWGAESACQNPTTCKQSGSMASCTCGAAGCVLNTQQCGPGGGVQSCVQNGTCTTWGAESACQGPATCHQTGASAVCCANACAAGASQCGPGGGVQTCVMGAACTSWSSEIACQAPKACQASGQTASCMCPASCMVGAQKCGPNGGVQTCVASGACTIWGPEGTACQAPATCQQSGNTASCVCTTCPPTDSLDLYVEADKGLTFDSSGTLKSWLDQSGMGHDGTPSANPATKGEHMLAGFPTVQFSGNGGPVAGSQGVGFKMGYSNYTAGVTIVALLRTHDFGVPFDDIGMHFPEFFGGPNNTTMDLTGGPAMNGVLSFGYTASLDATSIGATFPADKWALVEVIHQPSGAISIYVDGTLAGQGSMPTPLGFTRSVEMYGGGTPGEAALVFIYHRALSSTERITVENYVVNKWRYR
jgi:hypothetical protein